MGLGTSSQAAVETDTDLIWKVSNNAYAPLDGSLAMPSTKKFRVVAKFPKDSYDLAGGVYNAIKESIIFTSGLNVIAVEGTTGNPYPNVLTVVSPNQICSAPFVVATDVTGSVISLVKDTDWKYDAVFGNENKRLTIDIITNQANKWIVCGYIVVDRSASIAPGFCAARAIWEGAGIPKTNTNILGVAWTFEFA
jgi:hypothetical protein